MKATSLAKVLLSGALILIASLALAPSVHAARPARTIKKSGNTSGSYTTGGGRSGTFTNSVNRQPGSATRTTTWNPSTGGQGVQTANRTYDKSTGTGTRSSSTTHPDGKTTSSQGTLSKSGNTTNYNGTYTNAQGQSGTVTDTRTKTANGYTNDRTITRPNGQTVEEDRSVTHNPDGTTSIQNSATGPRGTVSDSLTRTPSASGFNTTGTYTNAQGQNGTINRTDTRTTNSDGSVTNTLDTTIGRPNGQTLDRESSVTVKRDPPRP